MIEDIIALCVAWFDYWTQDILEDHYIEAAVGCAISWPIFTSVLIGVLNKNPMKMLREEMLIPKAIFPVLLMFIVAGALYTMLAIIIISILPFLLALLVSGIILFGSLYVTVQLIDHIKSRG